MNNEQPKLLDAEGKEIEPKEKPSPIERMGWSGKSKDVVIKGNTAPTIDRQEE